MQRAIDETSRRRAKQIKFNKDHGITPVTIHKAIRDLTDELKSSRVAEPQAEYKTKRDVEAASRAELQKLMNDLEVQMKEAAKNLDFERAAALRDEMYELKALLGDDPNLKPWEKLKYVAGREE
jgi:excinuclease ABC subunit B